MAESIVEFVGGPPAHRTRPALLRRVLAVVLAAVFMVAIVGGVAVALSRLHQPLLGARSAAAAAAVEPGATRAFTQALQRLDPVAMRAQVTATCLADDKSNLCFGPESDSQFKTAMSGHTLSLTFLHRYDALPGTVVLYDMLISNRSTGRRDDLVLILRLGHDGKIDHALVS